MTVKTLLYLCALLFLTSCAEHYVKTSAVIDHFPGLAVQKYVPGTEDLPLYHGFNLAKNGHLSYDSTRGRIIDAQFHSRLAKAADVRKFYELTLPQLGWNLQEYQIYEREGEVLRLNILEKNGHTSLKVAIRPSIDTKS